MPKCGRRQGRIIRYLQGPGKGHDTHRERGMTKEITEDFRRFITDIGSA
jgi:hypothetical protein